jgi:chitodextrinase
MLPAGLKAQTTGLVAAYSFNEGTGTTVTDYSGNGVTGTVHSTTWTSGKYGGALAFNGASAYVDLGNPTVLRLTGSMTWSAWILATANPADDGQIIAKSNGNGWQFKTTPDTGAHTFGIGVSANSTSITQRYSRTVRALNTWYFVAGVYNAAAQTLDIYVNGVLDNGGLSGTVPASQFNSSVNVNIGRRTGGFYFKGTIDEVRMYNRALSAAEIVADMNTPIGAAADTQPPTTPAGLTATAVSASQISLSWTASTDNVAVSGYRVERCQGAGCSNFVQVATSAAVAYNDTGLAAGTSYSYRVRAADTTGNLSPYSSVATATTSAASDTQPPTAPAALTATAAGSTGMNLGWTAATDNVGVTGYLVERCQGVGCSTFAQAGTATALAFNDTGLTAGTSYSYRVRATDAAGNLGSYSNVATASTQSSDTQPPTAPSNLSALATSSSQVNLNWTAATDNVGVSGYRVERCQGTSCTDFTQIATPAGIAYSDMGLTANTSYSYRVRAVDGAGNLSGYSNTASVTTPIVVSSLVAAYGFNEGSGTTTADASGHAITGTLVNSTWNTSGKYGKALSFNGTSGYVDMGNPTAFQLTGSITLSAWVFATATPPDDGQILAKSSGNDGWQLKTTADTGVRTFAIAIANGGLSIQRNSQSVVALNTWYHVAGVYNAAAQTLNIYVNGVLSNGILTGTVPAALNNSTANVNAGRRSGGYYFIGTIDEARIYSGALSQGEIQADMNAPVGVVDTQAPTAPSALIATAAGGAQINLSWTASTDNFGVAGYLVERCQGAGCNTFAQIAAPAGVGTTYSDTGLVASTIYIYRVRATDGVGNMSPYSNLASATTSTPDTEPPTAPGTLTATAASGVEIDLVWGAATDNIGVTGYRVERCQGAGCTIFTKLGTTITGTAFNDTGLATNTSYSYIVRAQDAAGNLGPYTNVAAATTQGTNPQLISAYSFNEGSGTTVTDLSGNGNNGIISNATWTGSGKYGSGLVFNGTTAQITINDSASLHLTTGLTLEAWVNPTTVSSAWRDVIYKGDDNYYLEATTAAGGVPAIGQLVGSTHGETYGLTPLPVNTWTHLAATYDGIVQRLYVNGTEVANHPQTGSIVTSSNPLQIGGDNIYSQHFAGMIDEVRVYNVALKPSDIQADMATPLGTSTSPVVSLSRSSVDFGNQAVGTTSNASMVTLTNIGGSTLTISSIAITGAQSGDFAQTNTCGGPLAANGSCTINVTFAPTVAAARSASLSITDNAPGTPHTVTLTGTGLGFSISPHTVVLTPSQTQQFMVSNQGTGGVIWSVDTVAGGSPGAGTITTAGLYTAPGTAGTHTVTVTTSDHLSSSSATVYITANPGMLTHHNDNFRTGQNTQETILRPANVNVATFGKLFSYPTDGISHASPLYLANVNIPGMGLRNVVYVSTEHDSVYAFDADQPGGAPLWHTSFINPAAGITTVTSNDVGECCDITPEIGITGTPVIDAAGGTLYVVAKTKESGTFVQRLHALSVATGAEKFGGPVVLQGSVTGSGVGAVSGHVPFDSLREDQRTALLLLNGVVYFGFGSHGDNEPYHGWLLGYNATTLQQVLAYNSTPNGEGGGIWHSGGGLVADPASNIYFVTGDGTFNANTSGVDYGDSFIKFSAGGVVDYFTPHDQNTINSNNLDLGAGGLVLLPDQPGAHPHLLVGAGKNGTIYLVDRDSLGHYNTSSNTNVQTLQNIFPFGTPLPGNYNSPVYFNGSVYFGPVADNVQAFRLSNGLLSTSPTSRTVVSYAYPGGALAISANGNTNGILWAVEKRGLSPGTLHAYDAGNLANELYNSDQAVGARDVLDSAAKFSIPLVVNGKVFVASEGRLTVYGLLP